MPTSNETQPTHPSTWAAMAPGTTGDDYFMVSEVRDAVRES